MKIKEILKSMFLFTLTILALFASGCAEKNLSAEDIATRMLEKQDSVEDYSYTCTLLTTWGKGHRKRI